MILQCHNNSNNNKNWNFNEISINVNCQTNFFIHPLLHIDNKESSLTLLTKITQRKPHCDIKKLA